MWIFLMAALLAASDSPDLIRARQQLKMVRQQVAQGLVPNAAVAGAEEAVADAVDETILNQTLYGRLRIEDLTGEQAGAMVSAAQRRAERTQAKVEKMQTLVEAGVAEQERLSELQSQLTARTEALDEAQARAALVNQIVGMAREETEQVSTPAREKTEEHFDGEQALNDEDIRDITLAFEKHFREPFPVSARGETAVHRALGFDHTGRVDVAVTPDSAEGLWLRRYLEQRSIPYYAFRAAIPGKATAAHIHIGPASTRLHLTD